MKLTEVQIRYLLTVYHLSRNGFVRSSEIADRLGVSRPSTHRMLNQLIKKNLIVKDCESMIHLTEKGRDLAWRFEKQFFCISRFMNEYLYLSADAAENSVLSILSRQSLNGNDELCRRIHEITSENGDTGR